MTTQLTRTIHVDDKNKEELDLLCVKMGQSKHHNDVIAKLLHDSRLLNEIEQFILDEEDDSLANVIIMLNDRVKKKEQNT